MEWKNVSTTYHSNVTTALTAARVAAPVADRVLVSLDSTLVIIPPIAPMSPSPWLYDGSSSESFRF